MIKLNARYAVFVYGAIQAAITTAVATGIATHQLTELGWQFLHDWGKAWLIAWLTMLPLVVLVAPLIRRAVLSITYMPGETPPSSNRSGL